MNFTYDALMTNRKLGNLSDKSWRRLLEIAVVVDEKKFFPELRDLAWLLRLDINDLEVSVNDLIEQGFISVIDDDYYLFTQLVEFGYVYIAKNTHLYKIGMTNDLDRRLSQLTYTVDGDLELKLYIKDMDYKNLEKELHRIFDHKRKHGEWFELSHEDLKWIAEKYNGKWAVKK